MKRILVISLAGIGDTLMATPLIHELRVQFPQAELDAFVVWPGSSQILAGNPHLSAVRQHHLIDAPKLSSLRFLLDLRRRHYDASFTCHPQGRREYRIVTRIIGAHRRLSHRYENNSWIDRLLVTDTLPQDYTAACAINNLRLLSLLGRDPIIANPAYELFLSPDELAWAERWVSDHHLVGRRWLGVHVGSGGTKNLALRRWPETHWAGLFARLRESHPDLSIAAFGGPGEIGAHQRLRNQAPNVLFPVFPDLRHAAALIGHATTFLSVDTVFMHLAAARRVPRQFVIGTPTLNPPVHPFRPDWTLIPNPAVGGRALDYYRYDGRPIAGTPDELVRIMGSVTVEAVCAGLRDTAEGRAPRVPN